MSTLTAWRDWPTTERDSGSPMDFVFLSKWRDRYQTLRNVPHPGPPLFTDTWTPPTPNTYADWNLTREVWCPPWAEAAVVSFSAKLNIADPPDTGNTYIANFRVWIGSASSNVAQVRLGCILIYIPAIDDYICVGACPGCDGDPIAGDNVYYRKEVLVYLTDAERDAVSTFKIEGTRSNTNIADISVDTTQQYSSFYWSRG